MNKKKTIGFVWILLFLIVLSISFAIPVPHGIDGTIYELDGITPVGSKIDFSVYNSATGELIEGKTKNNGYYSVSLNGNNGNKIIIKAWNKYHHANRTVILDRVMHNVDLLLDMSEFTSKSETGNIALKEETEKKELRNIIVTGPKEQYIISGVVFEKNKQIDGGTKLRIMNGNKAVETETGIGNNPGAYYVTVEGSYGDSIEIEVQKGDYASTSLVLEGDMKNVNLQVNEDELLHITGNVIATSSQISGKSIWAIGIVLVICFAYLEYKRRKEEIL